MTVTGLSGNGATLLDQTGEIVINGGTLNTFKLFNNGGTLNFISGTLGITGTSGLTIGSTGPLGNDVTFASGQTVNITNATTIDDGASLTLNAGSFNSGSVTLNSTSTLAIGLEGTDRDGQYGVLTASGQLALDGSLVVSLNNFTPSAGQSFDILDFASLSGAFATLNLPALTGSLQWDTSQLYVTGLLSVVFPGDYNHDGTVDAADYVVWRKTGINGQQGYDTWRANFGVTAGSGAALPSANPLSAAVPEPATFMLLVFATAGWYLRRRRAA